MSGETTSVKQRCAKCGLEIDSFAANPGLWPIWTSAAGDNGETRVYHQQCVLNISELTQLRADNARLRQALMDPPDDIQEAVVKKLNLVSGEALLKAEDERDTFHRCLLAREQSLKNEGERWVKAMTERDEARTDLQSHKAALEKARVALKEAQNSLALSADLHNEIAAYGSCDCNLPKGEVCIPCQCEKQTSIDNAALALIHGTLTTINELLQKGSK